jgi:hypothetical protein
MTDFDAKILWMRWYDEYPPSSLKKILRKKIDEARKNGTNYITLIAGGDDFIVAEQAYSSRVNAKGKTFCEYIAEGLPSDVSADVHISVMGRVFIVMGYNRFFEGYKGGMTVIVMVCALVYLLYCIIQ